MVQISDTLCYQLTKNHHAYLKKRNGRTNRTGSIQFSTEPGNLKNINTLKYSGICKSQTIDISAVADDANRQTVQMTLLVASKAGVSRGSASKRTVPLKKNVRKSVKTMAKLTNLSYRSDLSEVALARYAKVKAGCAVANGVKGGVKVKNGRA
eukprot:CAMPEP_0116018554 /NCGR_PEP_ID=MMETSP0321-20121206/8712_1 /TAXON_ID=163516 /ORGANISM="Leptocylindrus danicus var. danicus, Strain B650" /LENGTH=152 /DNA_ID=CAMNT_0003488959 /DNA_START=75 /DNA_END=533 /DNA_ORIENTATION=-